MRRATRRALVVCLVAGAIGLAGAPTALAQDAANATATETAPTDNVTVVSAVDEETVVSDTEWDGEVLEITIVADESRAIYVMEAIPMDERGGTTLAVEQTHIDPGTTTLEITPTNHPAAVINTPQGSEAGQVAFVQAEAVSDPAPPVPFDAAVALIGLVAGATVAVTIRAVRAELTDTDDTVERIA